MVGSKSISSKNDKAELKVISTSLERSLDKQNIESH